MQFAAHAHRWWFWRLTLKMNSFERSLRHGGWSLRVGTTIVMLALGAGWAAVSVGNAVARSVYVAQPAPAKSAPVASEGMQGPQAVVPTETPQPALASASEPAPSAAADTMPAQLPDGGTGQAVPPLEVMAAEAVSVGDADTGARGGYTGGQCTYYVASRRNIPGGWGNARNWKSAAERSGYKTGSTPAVGAVAWTARGWAGHVALVEAVSADGGEVTVSEMNYRGPWRVTSRTVPASSFPAYIY